MKDVLIIFLLVLLALVVLLGNDRDPRAMIDGVTPAAARCDVNRIGPHVSMAVARGIV